MFETMSIYREHPVYNVRYALVSTTCQVVAEKAQKAYDTTTALPRALTRVNTCFTIVGTDCVNLIAVIVTLEASVV